MPADDTGDDIEIGMTNKGTDGTELIGDASPHGNFGNDYVLRVDSSPLITNRADVDGIRGFAHNRGRGVFGRADGSAGVWGEGPTGVQGEGQTGVLGNGGTVGVQGNSNGTAVLGMSMGGTGVFGGSNSRIGVVGRSDGTQAGAIGVQGAADNANGIGVQGISSRGIAVFATTGAGTALEASAGRGIAVNAHSAEDRGGVFASKSAAQLRLIPHDTQVKDIPTQPFSAQALNLKGHETMLPVNGQLGDLLCTSMVSAEVKQVGVLWLCVMGGDKNDPAQWCQVLLGPAIQGQG